MKSVSTCGQKGMEEEKTYFSPPPGKSRPRRSLHHRLVLGHVAILGIILFLIGGAVYSLVSYYLLAHADALLRTEGEKLQDATQTWLQTGRPMDSPFLNWLANQDQTDEFDSYPLYIKLFDTKTGMVLKRSASLAKIRLPFHDTDFQAALHGHRVLNTYQDSRGRLVRVLTLPLSYSSHPSGRPIMIAQISLSLEAIKQVQMLLIILFTGGSFCALFIAYSFGSVLTHRELRPLTRLSQKMAEVALIERHFPLIPPQRTREMDMLATAFNQMVEHLKACFLLQEHFVTDISHELRTPLTSIRGYIDLLLLNPTQDEEARQDLYQMQTEIDRLSRLVANILTNARSKIGIFPQYPEYPMLVDLDGLLLETMQQMRFVKPRVTIAFGQIQPIEIPGDRDLLKQLFLNLLDNALTYTPPGGRVTVDIVSPEEDALSSLDTRTKRSWVTVALRDTGPGINESDLPHLFERHYRASNRTAQGKQNCGLGLSIALMLAQAHGGTIIAENASGEGACFTVWLPLTCARADSTSPGSLHQ